MSESSRYVHRVGRADLMEALECLHPGLGALIAVRSGEARDEIRRKLNHETHRRDGECKPCKGCGNLKAIYKYDASTNSDDGLFPICRSCVARMEFNHQQKYNRYFPNRMER